MHDGVHQDGPDRRDARFPVRRCLQAILNEEWEHRRYAERDLDVLQPKAN